MKERPILFSAPMVRALLDGTKTQTRRVVKPGNLGLPGLPLRQPTPNWNVAFHGPGIWSDDADFSSRCPYGLPGDRLWVREAIRLVPDQEPDDGTGRVLSVYGADGSLTVADAWPWKRPYLPPMHCPRGLSRIDLEITGVRVERLQEITEGDIIAEGCPREILYGTGWYRDLWEQINGAGSWAANPWVWVIEFRRIKP